MIRVNTHDHSMSLFYFSLSSLSFYLSRLSISISRRVSLLFVGVRVLKESG
jgi:hypothetical protein